MRIGTETWATLYPRQLPLLWSLRWPSSTLFVVRFQGVPVLPAFVVHRQPAPTRLGLVSDVLLSRPSVVRIGKTRSWRWLISVSRVFRPLRPVSTRLLFAQHLSWFFFCSYFEFKTMVALARTNSWIGGAQANRWSDGTGVNVPRLVRRQHIG